MGEETGNVFSHMHNLVFNFMYMGMLPACIPVIYIHVVPTETRILDPLNLELQMTVSHQVGGGN